MLICVNACIWTWVVSITSTYWDWVTHMCVNKQNIIGLSPDLRQAIIWTNAGILLIWPLWTNLSEMAIETRAFSSRKLHLKMSCEKCWTFCLDLNVLNQDVYVIWNTGDRYPLQWRHNEHDGVLNHQRHHCLLNRLFGCRSKKTSKLRVTGLCAGNSPGTGEFPAQKASNAENVSI